MIRRIKSKAAILRADPHLWEVVEGATSSLMIQILGAMSGFVVSIAIARTLGAEGAGVYYLAMSIATIAATVGRVGFENTVVRFVASHASAQEWGAVRQVYRTAMKVVAAASLLISVALFFGAEWVAVAIFAKSHMELPLRLVAISVLPLSFAMIQAETLRGLRSIRASQLIKNVLTSLGTLILLYPLVSRLGANGAVAAFVTAAVATAFTAWFLWQREWKSRGKGVVNSKNGFFINELFRSSWPLYGVALTGLVMQQAATVFLGIWGNTGDVGIFNVANRMASLLLFPLMAMISILTPKFAAMYKQGEMKELARLSRSSSKILTFFALPVALLVALVSEQLLSVFGAEFADGAMILRILLIGVVINAATGAVAELLMMSGFERVVSGGVATSAFITLALCLVLIPVYGQVGAAIAATCGMSLQNLIMMVGVKMKLGFWPVSLTIR